MPEIEGELTSFREIANSLPLEQCSFGRNQVTGELGWRAPDSRIFRVTGQFELISDQSHIEEWSRPLPSKTLLLADNQELYTTFLSEAEGDKEKAFQLLLEAEELEYYDIPDFFDGKWLVVTPNIESSSTLIHGRSSAKASKLLIKTDINAWYDQNYVSVIQPEPLGLRPTETLMYDGIEGVVKWKQQYVEVLPGGGQVELVEYDEPKPRLYIPKTKEGIAVPIAGSTSIEFAQAIADITGHQLTDEERLALIRNRRELGIPYSDDPLKDVVFIKPPRMALPSDRKLRISAMPVIDRPF